MGLFSFLFGGSGGKSKSGRVFGSGAKRSFAPYPKAKNPFSRRSTGNTSRYKRF